MIVPERRGENSNAFSHTRHVTQNIKNNVSAITSRGTSGSVL